MCDASWCRRSMRASGVSKVGWMCGLKAKCAKVSTGYAMSYSQCAMVCAVPEQSFDPGQAKAVSHPMNVAADCRHGGG